MASNSYSLEQLQALNQECNLGRLLVQVSRNFFALAAQKYHQRGYDGLSPAHAFLMASVNAEGTTRIVDLAARMDTTKQFAGRLVKDLEQRGYVTTEPDAQDRRALNVTVTRAGWVYFAAACEVKAEIEAEFQTALGAEAMTAFLAALQTLARLPVAAAQPVTDFDGSQ
ncbi:MAG TPA: MarR family winged helix-turn-helix transcriptional regulator [Phototrophicaceae bacterium]|nr:MarR family winged helix-turn-helix transcriptional regulator [Phototrophicaceae bacterium]